jgi:hypothetical protein
MTKKSPGFIPKFEQNLGDYIGGKIPCRDLNWWLFEDKEFRSWLQATKGKLNEVLRGLYLRHAILPSAPLNILVHYWEDLGRVSKMTPAIPKRYLEANYPDLRQLLARFEKEKWRIMQETDVVRSEIGSHDDDNPKLVQLRVKLEEIGTKIDLVKRAILTKTFSGWRLKDVRQEDQEILTRALELVEASRSLINLRWKNGFGPLDFKNFEYVKSYLDDLRVDISRLAVKGALRSNLRLQRCAQDLADFLKETTNKPQASVVGCLVHGAFPKYWGAADGEVFDALARGTSAADREKAKDLIDSPRPIDGLPSIGLADARLLQRQDANDAAYWRDFWRPYMESAPQQTDKSNG